MNVKKALIILFFSLILIQSVWGVSEEKFLQSWVQIKATNKNVTIKIPNVLEPKTFIMDGLSNTSKIQNYSYVSRALVECTTTELGNLTEKLIDTCNVVSDYTKTCGQIFATNTELSTQMIELKNKIDGQQSMQNSVNECQTLLTAERNKKNPNTQNNLGWFIGGSVVGVGGMVWYNNSRRRTGAEGARGGSRI